MEKTIELTKEQQETLRYVTERKEKAEMAFIEAAKLLNHTSIVHDRFLLNQFPQVKEGKDYFVSGDYSKIRYQE